MSASHDLHALSDAIYEAAFIPDSWPALLHAIASLTGTVGGALIATPPTYPKWTPALLPKPRWTTSEPVKDMFAAFFSEGWVAQCDWVGRARKLEHPGFVTDRDLFAPGEYEQTPSYKFYRRHGVGYGAGLFLQIPSSDRFAFVFEQRHEDGPIKSATIERLNQLRPDLARAALIACRLGLERAQAATQTLAILGLPAVVLSATHRMLAANDLMQALMPDIVDEHAGSRFHLTNRLADARLAAALANTLVAAHPSDVKPVFSIPLVAQAHHPAMVAHVVPVRRQARDLFVGATNLVIMTPVCNQQLPSTDVIQGLFDLTPAESRVARLIACGDTVCRIAVVSQRTEGTVRAQLKSIFAKTGVNRQAELVSLLGATTLRRESPL